jgi:hypothetical protein
MPLIVNVGLSRKASKDFQSTGVSINVTAELDQALLAKPAELQRQIGDLYQQAQEALNRQSSSSPITQEKISSDRACTRKESDNTGHRPNGNAITASQKRAISAIAARLGVDPRAEARQILGADLESLTVRQASELIDHLKGRIAAVDARQRR